MDTAYKSRTWWMLKALTYAYAVIVEETYKGYHPQQLYIWNRECDKAAANAVAPSGSPCLTRRYVDRQGNTLPQFLSA